MLTRVDLAGQTFWRTPEGRLYPDYLNHGCAMQFVQDIAERHCRGKGIDVGASEWPFWGAIPIQDRPDENAYSLARFPDGSLDYVFSSHCLEHLERPREAMALWVRKLRRGGVLFLYLPHPSMTLWRPGGEWVGNGHKWSPDPQSITTMVHEAGAVEFANDATPDAYWSFWTVARKR